MENVIAQGSTPSLSFDLPMPTEEIAAINIVIWQSAIIIEFDINSVRLSNKQAVISLNQAQTLSLKAGYDTYVQVRVKTKSSQAYTSSMLPLTILAARKQEVI